jgi:hypothetical protein
VHGHIHREAPPLWRQLTVLQLWFRKAWKESPASRRPMRSTVAKAFRGVRVRTGSPACASVCGQAGHGVKEALTARRADKALRQ